MRELPINHTFDRKKQNTVIHIFCGFNAVCTTLQSTKFAYYDKKIKAY